MQLIHLTYLYVPFNVPLASQLPTASFQLPATYYHYLTPTTYYLPLGTYFLQPPTYDLPPLSQMATIMIDACLMVHGS